MKRKMITTLVSLVALIAVCATVGVSFAMWEAEPTEYSYVVNTTSFVNIEIADIVVDSGKLIPKSDSNSATVVVSTVDIDIRDYPCKLLFTASDIKFIDKQAGEEWLDVPQGILNIEFTDMQGSKITDKAPPFAVKKHTFKIKVSLLPHMEFIDPIYKDTQFKFNVHIDATAVV